MSGFDELKGITPRQLDELAAPLYEGLGRSLAKWQYVETSMFILAHAIMRCEYKYSSTAFYLLRGADIKLQLLNRLCEAHFSKELLKREWEPTYKDLSNAIKFRNGLAHFEVNYFKDPERKYLKEGDPPVVLSPHHTDVRESGKPMVKGAMLHNLNEAAALHVILAQRLVSLVRRHFSPEELRATQLPHQWLRLLWNTEDNPQSAQSPPSPSRR